MQRSLLFLLFIIRGIGGISQTQHHYYGGAIEKLKNRSWVCERTSVGGVYTNNEPYYNSLLKSPRSYFLHNDESQSNLTKYEKRLACSSITEYPYFVDTSSGKISGYVHLCELEDWVFIDSNADGKNTYFFVFESSGDYKRDGILTGDVFKLSFLSDSEFVVDNMSSGLLRKGFYKQYPTFQDFYRLYGLTPN